MHTLDSAGALDGRTILRFAHAFEKGGGMEQLLEDLDRVLLERNALQLIRVYIAPDPTCLDERSERVGRGQLIRVPLPLTKGESVQLTSDRESARLSLRNLVRNYVLYQPPIWNLFTRPCLLSRSISRRPGQVVGAGIKVAELAKRYRLDLVMLHYMGGADSDEIVEWTRKSGVPFGVQNHYSNDRFLHLSIRKHAMLAAGVAGVNGLGVPKYLKSRFCNLSDGIDLEFMSLEAAGTPSVSDGIPVLLLPARVVRTKGHLDLVEAGCRLQALGVSFRIVFAGRADSGQFVETLRRRIQTAHLSEKVSFLGALSQEQLRAQYAVSTVVVLPTYHHEGLGRVIVEAQAMKRPVVAYATGGVPEAILERRSGFLVSTGNITALTERLRELLARPDLCSQMGDAGRSFALERYSLEAVARRHETFYLALINSGSHCGRVLLGREDKLRHRA